MKTENFIWETKQPLMVKTMYAFTDFIQSRISLVHRYYNGDYGLDGNFNADAEGRNFLFNSMNLIFPSGTFHSLSENKSFSIEPNESNPVVSVELTTKPDISIPELNLTCYPNEKEVLINDALPIYIYRQKDKDFLYPVLRIQNERYKDIKKTLENQLSSVQECLINFLCKADNGSSQAKILQFIFQSYFHVTHTIDNKIKVLKNIGSNNYYYFYTELITLTNSMRQIFNTVADSFERRNKDFFTVGEELIDVVNFHKLTDWIDRLIIILNNFSGSIAGIIENKIDKTDNVKDALQVDKRDKYKGRY